MQINSEFPNIPKIYVPVNHDVRPQQTKFTLI
jgi:hypothetical protein